ncbi:phosphoribosylformylglycinamidine synthase [Candidatus Gottesmanbacteria bacterium]|nr:phosphoribosylformylglycinamidine synthase [Candidatus Gottesmanbacteria bacterium]
MITRIEISSIDSDFITVYTIDKKLSSQQISQIADILTNPVSQKASINKQSKTNKFLYAYEIGFLPGVTDNIANTSKEIIEDKLKNKFRPGEGVYSSKLFFATSKPDSSKLINPLIQRIHIKSKKDYLKNKGMDKIVPKVNLSGKLKVDLVDLNVSDEELTEIGKSGIKDKNGTRRGPLALDLTYMKTIAKYFKKHKRKPTDVELESIAQTWSEHCKHTIFADPIDEIKEGLFKTYIKGATVKINKPFCVSVFTDNSGAIEFDKDYLITHKVETHNSPSALDPFGGAITGIVGVNRDAIGFGLGAKPIVNTYGFCFAPPALDKKVILYKDKNLSNKMLPPLKILQGVVDGVNSGGNCSGIPTTQGFLVFDNRFAGKPLVFVGTVGLIPKNAYRKKAQKGDYIVMVGGRVGQDGIHGATFSSEALDSGSPATAVQIGDPITQKKLSDALIKEARKLNLYNSITDNGAGGLSCSVAEMAKECGGCIVELDKVPLKYPGLEPWKIWISESQERMTLAVPAKEWKKFYNLMRKRGVEATVIGEFNDSGRCVVDYKGKRVMDIDMQFLHYGLPKRPMKTVKDDVVLKEPKLAKVNNLTSVLNNMLSRLNICGYEFISKQYDHEVQASSVLKPLAGKRRINTEVTAVRPRLDSNKAVILSQGILPFYSDIDTYHMASSSIDTAIRNVVAAGGDPNTIALLDNFCWCSSNDSYRLYQLKQAAKACSDYSLLYKTPFISGKDSMFNDFKGYDKQGKPIKISIPPTLLISSICVIDNYLKVVSIDVKFPGDLVYILGDTYNELGASEYFSMLGYIGNCVPKIDAIKNRKLYNQFYKAVKNNLVASAISVGRGGFGVALAKTAMSGNLGMDISLGKLPGKFTRDEFALFSESQGRTIATVAPQNKKMFEKLFKGLSIALIGKVTSNKNIIINVGKKKIVDLSLQTALKSYKSNFKNL